MFSETQTFIVDSSIVQGASEVGLSKVRLFFRAKPNATGNKSGIVNPGVTLYIIPVTNGVPDLTNLLTLPFTRVEYTSIQVSSDATAFTDFTFATPVQVKTGQEWAFSVSYDGNEDFILWKSKQGDTLVASDQTSPGPSGSNSGKYFTYITGLPGANGTNNVANGQFGSSGSSSANTATATQDYLAANWKSRSDVDIKFTVFCARYRNNGSSNLVPLVPNNTPVEAAIMAGSIFYTNFDDGSFGYQIPSRRYEHITYDASTSFPGGFDAGQTAWQRRPFYPNNKTPATVSIAAGSTAVTASGNVNFNNVYTSIGSASYLVAVSENHRGAGIHSVAARRVLSISSNNTLILSDPMPITNTAAKFYLAPVGAIAAMGPRQTARQTYLLSLVNSSANGTVRFSNSGIEHIAVVAGGTGYNNNDVVKVSGYESVAGKVIGGANASAVLTTNATGGIVNVHMAVMGAGFSNANSVVVSVSNSTGGSTTGSGANLSPVIGMSILSEQAYNGTDGHLHGGIVVNLDATSSVFPSLGTGSLGTYQKINLRLPYFKVKDPTVVGGWAYYCDDADADNDLVPVTAGAIQTHRLNKSRVTTSWSNEQVITYAIAGTAVAGKGCQANATVVEYPGQSNSAVILVEAASNNDFVTITVPPFVSGMGFFNINEDSTLEYTNYGNAYARGISEKFGFANNALAEDALVFARVYRPALTDMEVYVKIHNSSDPDAFDDKEWTKLQVTDGASLYSSRTDTSDFVKLTYGFPSYPPGGALLTGKVTLANGSANVVGQGTNFGTEVLVGDLVRIYSTIFPTNYVVSLVTAVANTTQLTLSEPVSNASVADSGLRIEKVGRPQQAFVYGQNDGMVRYYSDDLVVYDAYDSIQVKFVFLSSDPTIIPRMDDYQMVGVSA